MAQVSYDVELIVQEQNPICWVASCAMVKGYCTRTSIGVGEFTGGFDPSNSCIGNLAANWNQCTTLMSVWGFNVYSFYAVSSPITGDSLAQLLQINGPAVLLHNCNGFPYGPSWTPLTSGAHAVVLTGVDSGAGTATFNNPWGDKDQPIDLQTLVDKINKDAQDPWIDKTIGFWGSWMLRS